MSNARYKIYNLGTTQPVECSSLSEIIEQAVGSSSTRLFARSAGDVVSTYAQMDDLYQARNSGTTPIEEGLRNSCVVPRIYRQEPVAC